MRYAAAAIVIGLGGCGQGPVSGHAVPRPADAERIAKLMEDDFRQLCLSDASSAEAIFATARASGWQDYGVPNSLLMARHPTSEQNGMTAINTPAGPTCSINNLNNDGARIAAALWRNLGVATDAAPETTPIQICRRGVLEGRGVRICSIDFQPHGTGAELSLDTTTRLANDPLTR